VAETSLTSLELYAPALKACIEQHAFLSTTIGRAGSSEPAFTRPQQLNLRNHFRVLSGDDMKSRREGTNEVGLLTWILEQLHNEARYRFDDVENVPAWSLDVMSLEPQVNNHRVLVFFTYSHSHGDGMSSLAFHQTFFNAFKGKFGRGDFDELVKSPEISLPSQPDSSSTMPISIPYLLIPALGTYLPSFLIKLFALSGNAAGADQSTWDGSPIFIDNTTAGMEVTTSVEFLDIPAEALQTLLMLCRKQRTTLTPLLNYIIAGAAIEAFAQIGQAVDPSTNFVAQVPINLRTPLGVSSSEIGNFASAAYSRYEYQDVIEQLKPNNGIWEKLSSQSKHLASAASTLQDQPIGLLRYVSDLRTWMLNKIGQRRGSSWEFSNLGSFDPHGSDQVNPEGIGLEKMLFSQPASPQSAPLSFSVVGLKTGGLSICVSWQMGALALEEAAMSRAGRERAFVRQVVDSMLNKIDQMK
jgi:hypothetical protein